LTIAFAARPVPSSRLIALNASPARLGADPPADLLQAELGQDERVHEGLGHRLQRERVITAARPVSVAVHADQRQAEVAPVGRRELRDVGRDLALVHMPQPVVHLRQRVADDIEGRGHRHGSHGSHAPARPATRHGAACRPDPPGASRGQAIP